MDTREPTEIEASLFEGIIVRLMQKMREAWSYITFLNPALRHIETNAMFVQIARPKDKVIMSGMEIEIDGVTGKMNFCVPYYTVEALFDRLSGKYINKSNSDILAKLSGEIQNLKNNFAELKTDISSDISRQFKINRRLNYLTEDFEPDYAAMFSEIVKKDIAGIVKLVSFYLMRDDYKKAAVFLTTLGAEASTKIFKRLREDEIESLTFGIARHDTIGYKQKTAVLKEFWDMYDNNKGACFGGIDFARVVLEKSVGEKKTIDIINRLTSALQVRPFDFIRRVEAEHLYTFINEEHPQIIALILSYLKPENAAVILQKFSSVSQIDIIRRIENLEKTSPEVLREIEKILEKKLASLSIMDYCISGGSESVKEILKCVAPASKKQIVNAL
jgi:predicted transcriptional regulator